MRANSTQNQGERRGIVLVLILGILALMALIGVTFATFSGQSRIGARNYAQSTMNPLAVDMMDFALAQLIGDTNDVRSAIRGHSMARDMYGNDAANNGLVTANLSAASTTGLMQFTAATVYSNGTDPKNGLIQCVTNIPLGDAAYYGFDFTRWLVKFPPQYLNNGGGTASFLVGQTFEIVVDDNITGVNNFRIFYLTPPATAPAAGAPNHGYIGARSQAPTAAGNYVSPEVDKTTGATSTVASELSGEYMADQVAGSLPIPLHTTLTAFNNVGFVLDGRYLRAFNGPGMAANAVYGNFRYNGGLLAGGTTVTPGDPNVVGMDEDYDACDLENWFLAIQSADGKVIVPSFHRPGILRGLQVPPPPVNDWISPTAESQARILRPRAADGHDQTAFPNLYPDPTTGKITFDVDNDGDGQTDSVWVDLGYPPRQDTRGQLYKPMFAFMVIGLNGRIPLNTAGNLHMRDDSGGRFGMHSSHLGNSPSEVDPTFALQNASNTDYQSTQFDNAYVATPPVVTQLGDGSYTMVPAAGEAPVTVNVTQFRNILTGTRPPLNRFAAPSGTPVYGDANFVLVNGQPWFIPNNLPDGADLPSSAGSTVINLPPNTVAGRWGEPGYIPSAFDTSAIPLLSFSNLIRAGMSGYFSKVAGVTGLQDLADARDDNFNAYDFWPSTTPGVTIASVTYNGAEQAGPAALPGVASGTWPADYYDAAGDLALPVERSRRFVTPADVTGEGSIVNFSNPTGPMADTGADAFGRVAYKRYFRAEGVPVATETIGTLTTKGTPSFPDITNNPLHGYDSQRNPNIPGTIPGTPRELDYAGAPADLDSTGAQTVDGMGNPTAVSGGFKIPTFNSAANTLARGLNINEADEMKLYQVSQLDAPFGYGDLEWLYREQDKDGGTLHSRLADLAPISFTNPTDGLRRRRLFSIDAWDSNGFVWTPDNPRNAFSDNSITPWPTAAYIANGIPLLTANAGLYSVFAQTQSIYNATTATIPVSTIIQNLEGTPNTPNYVYSGGVSLAHRDRKINLNYPLPVSNDPNEPTRNKWITETYNFLKKALPPLSVQYPEQLAQLSQYLINVIDFRDPDATMTHWQNPDVVFVPGNSTTTPPTAPYLAFVGHLPAGVTGVPLDQYGMEYNPVSINEVLAFSYQYYTGSAGAPSNRFFVELVNNLTSPNATSIIGGVNPSAVDLSGFNYTTGDPYSGGCWDMVLTADDPESRPDPFRGDLIAGTTSNAKWYGLIPLNRDAFNQTTSAYDVTLLPLNNNSAAMSPPGGGTTTSIPQPPATQTSPPTDYFYVIGNNPASAGTEQGTPAPATYWPSITTTANTATTPYIAPNTPTLTQALAINYDPMNGTAPSPYPFKVYQGVLPGALDPTGGNQGTLPANYNWKIPSQTIGTVTYYWVCLRRPANPFAAVSATNPMIVVDSMRFPYIEGTGPLTVAGPAGGPAMVPDPTNANTIYSVQRFQPFRGGHAVPYYAPPTGTLAPPSPPNAPPLVTTPPLDAHYGYTDQMVVPGSGASGALIPWSQSLGTRGIYYNDGTNNYYATGGLPTGPSTGTSTAGAFHTLGWANEVTDNWSYFPFHDRDFTSVAELTLVPGCPAGLFTKQFVENVAATGFVNTLVQTSPINPSPFRYAVAGVPQVPQTGGTGAASSLLSSTPPTGFPYLVDRFFYTSTSRTTPAENSATSGNWDVINGPVSGGWHKMFEFFEVPSPAFGAVGQVAQGTNYDWLRQDSRPGQLNLNLIIDEEVFLGLMGNAGARTDQPGTVQIPAGTGPTYTLQQVTTTPSKLNASPIVNTPQVATQWDYTIPGPAHLSATQWAAYPLLTNSGFYDSNNNTNALKAAFADFLKLRHGGTGYMFGGGAEAPFHSLTYPDVNFTIMRPAFPPNLVGGVSQNGVSGADAAVKNYQVANRASATVVYPPSVPPRRLFQIPDTDASTASLTPPDLTVLGYKPANNHQLQVPAIDLTSGSVTPANWLSAAKEHPYFRSEWMQKMMNLTTVRTHQFAVWITVGFFEVKRQGDPTVAFTNPAMAYDIIGREVGLLNGKNVRYRGFFIVNRLNLTGFDPIATGKYRDAVVYRETIE